LCPGEVEEADTVNRVVVAAAATAVAVAVAVNIPNRNAHKLANKLIMVEE